MQLYYMLIYMFKYFMDIKYEHIKTAAKDHI